MAPVAPLPTGETTHIGPYQLIGRFTPAVLVGRSPSGEQVVIKRFHRVAHPDRVAALRRTTVIGTARILDAGPAHILDAGPAYIVSEFVDGPSLEESERFSGPALHRLAIALMTTIAALHKAGIQHGDIRPDQVVLGPDGPRLLCHGTDATNSVAINGGPNNGVADNKAGNGAGNGAPSWRAPEELRGHLPGLPADIFGWAATILFAGHLPGNADLGRPAPGPADLNSLDGDLRQLVADCLAATPAERPTADEVLLRLIGHSGALHTIVPTTPGGPPRSAATPDAARRPSGLVLAAAGVAIALVSGGASFVLTPRPVTNVSAASGLGDPAGSAAATLPASGPTRKPVTLASPPQPTKKITLPTGGTVYEHPDDPTRLTSYQISQDGKTTVAYTRAPGENPAFKKAGGNYFVSVVSPNGRWMAGMKQMFYVETDRQVIDFTDQSTGSTFSVPALDSQYYTLVPQWSRDSSRLLLTVFDQREGVGSVHPKGFLVVDVSARQSTFVETENAEDVKAFLAVPEKLRPSIIFEWTPDGAGVVSPYVTPNGTYGLRFRDLSGRVLRSMHWAGYVGGMGDVFSPSGKMFAAIACEKVVALCLRDTVTGERRATIPLKQPASFVGWYDDNHVIVGYWAGKLYKTVVLNQRGEEVRTLAEFTAAQNGFTNMRYSQY